jgi:hypothetical protein
MKNKNPIELGIALGAGLSQKKNKEDKKGNTSE